MWNLKIAKVVETQVNPEAEDQGTWECVVRVQNAATSM